MRKKPDRSLRLIGGLRCNKRSLAIFSAIAALLAGASAFAVEIAFQLSPPALGADLAPSPEWIRSVTPMRDAHDLAESIQSFRLPAGAKKDPRLQGLFRIELSDDGTALALLPAIARAEGTLWAERLAPRTTCAIPGEPAPTPDAAANDPFYALQWSLDRIYAPAAWDVSRGDTGVSIAVIDVGVDINHSDLIAQRWVNQVEASGVQGADDDRNGFIDDIHGWDFVGDDNDPRPENGDAHGTHVAGIASAAADNGYGVAGVAGRCRIMALRAGAGTGIGHGFEALIYAAETGADVANLSWGSETESHLERIAVEYALSKGCVVIAAAGNTFEGTDFLHYPAAYNEAVAVAATDDADKRASFSNVGEWVDLSAPGASILSLLPANSFGVLSGTSMATPLVAGAAALVKSVHPDWTPERISMQLRTAADPIDSLNPTFAGKLGKGRLNLYRALADRRVRFDLEEFWLNDAARGDGDGIVDPGERLNMRVRIVNRLLLPATVLIELVSLDGRAQIDPVVVPFPEIPPGGSVENDREPFRFRVSPNASSGQELSLAVRISSGNRTHQELPLKLTVRAPSADLSGGRLAATVSNFGAIGYYDYIRRRGVGVGFRYPADGPSALFHGSLMLGVPGVGVSDCSYGDDEMSRLDFRGVGDGAGVISEGDGLVSRVEFDDSRAENPLGVVVRQTARLYPPDSAACLILEYRILAENSDLDSLYAGLYLDWDVLQSDENLVGYEPAERISWVEGDWENSPRFGVSLLNGLADFSAALNNRFIRSSFPDSLKMQKMLSGTAGAVGDSLQDWSQIYGVGPISLAQGDSTTLYFGLIAGKTTADLSAAVRSGRRRLGFPALSGEAAFQPTLLSVEGLYPSPFNGRTTALIRSLAAGRVRWSLIDPMGREAGGGSYGAEAGLSRLSLDLTGYPTGKYFIILRTKDYETAAPLLLVK